MNSKLTILADGKPLALKEDASISIELSNPLFNDTEMFSYPVELPIEGNRHFLKNVDDVSSDIRPVSYEHTPMQIIADGVPFASGTAIIQEDERLEDSLSLNIDASTQSFSDLISDLKCNEVPIPQKYHDQLLIGEKIDKVDVSEWKSEVASLQDSYQGIILSALTSCLRYTSCNTIPINGKNTFPGKSTNGTPLFTSAFLMETLFNATSYAAGHCNASSYFAFCFFIAATLSSISFTTSIIAKLTPYISTIIMSRIVIKIGNCNLFLYSAIFTLQPKYCSNCFCI